MTRLMETVESQHQASHSFPQALGNLAQTARFPHSLSSDESECELESENKDSEFECPVPSAGKTHNTYYRCSPRPWVTSLSDPTDTRLGYLLK
jgi:hypothetical protein